MLGVSLEVIALLSKHVSWLGKVVLVFNCCVSILCFVSLQSCVFIFSTLVIPLLKLQCFYSRLTNNLFCTSRPIGGDEATFSFTL